ncbi:protein of unknown function [Pseudodesulfovibrio profundus]|uniref:Uncharacterized protein n=1 Tax=Pseudodesulfovibrio profundus TaxID=57320 RepID=A0A2C8FEW0_9BACT|nr:hypothetical protein [Pseudodesulfovibrio profundus]SOB60599.1 protein of unknown function [Pseudodesulfovibrio profundus]
MENGQIYCVKSKRPSGEINTVHVVAADIHDAADYADDVVISVEMICDIDKVSTKVKGE